MRRLTFAVAWLALGCAGPVSGPPSSPPASVATVRAALPAFVTPATLVPELDDTQSSLKLRRQGEELHLVGGFRVAVDAAGKVTRSTERFVQAVEFRELPGRLGGGYLFHVSDARGTRLWRAERWSGLLRPLAFVARPTQDVIAGFDRIYLRGRYNGLVALDSSSGELMGLGPLPPAASTGPMTFVDGWRAVVDADVLGLLGTFDAGASWSRLPDVGAVRTLGEEQGDPVIHAEEGKLRVGSDGTVRRLDPEASGEDVVLDDDEVRLPVPRPLGPSPLRLAVERGIPEGPHVAVVAHRGIVARVSLPDGAVLTHADRAFRDADATCTGARVGRGLGFVCSTEGGATTVYRYQPPLRLVEVRRFAGPRFVAASDNGRLVLRGRCGGEGVAVRATASPVVPLAPSPRGPAATPPGPGSPSSDLGSLMPYCVLDGEGHEEEIVVRGEIGVERVVGLRDGAVALLIPPRPGADGTLHLIRGREMTWVKLSFPSGASEAVDLAKHGLWLDGARETEEGTIATWVEAGGRVVGVAVSRAGEVRLGAVQDARGQAMLSGRFGLAVVDERGAESIDGGRTWHSFPVPRLASPVERGTRACSAVGCTMRGWMRVGWSPGGEPTGHDVVPAPEPPPRVTPRTVATALRLDCEPLATERPPTADVGETRSVARATRPSESELAGLGWAPLKGVAPPPLGVGESGIGRASLPSERDPASVYAWGPAGGEWTRRGRWLARFEDRFAVETAVRSTAVGRAPWSNLELAAEVLGVGSRPSGRVGWQTHLDPGGRAALVSACRQAPASCELLSFVAGEVPLLLPSSPALRPPSDGPAIRLGSRWYFLATAAGSNQLELWRSDGERTASLSVLHRVRGTRSQTSPPVWLARRADESGLALVLPVPVDEVAPRELAQWTIVPVDPETGALGEPTSVGLSSFGDAPRPCGPDEDGWLVELQLPITTPLTLQGAPARLAVLEHRLRLGAFRSCLDGVAARSDRTFEPPARPPSAAPPSGPFVPLVVTSPNGSERWSFACRSR